MPQQEMRVVQQSSFDSGSGQTSPLNAQVGQDVKAGNCCDAGRIKNFSDTCLYTRYMKMRFDLEHL
jgi:hypothetical protein